MNSTTAIGVDIGGTRTKIGLVNLAAGTVLQTIVRPTETKDAALFMAGIVSAVNELESTAAEKNLTIESIGFGVPGYVYGNGMVDSTYGFLQFMEDYPLALLVETALGIPCFVDNDARVVALGEALFGEAKGYDRVLVLTLGTGLGLGFVVGGQFPDVYPVSHMAGHISIISGGDTCYCGKEGCLESLVSSAGLLAIADKIAWAQRYSAFSPAPENIFKAAGEQNRDARFIVEQWLQYLHKGVYNYANLFAPDVIVLGGGMAKGLGPYLPQLNKAGYLKPYKNYEVKIVCSALEERAGILGAAALLQSQKQLNTVQS